MLCAWTPILHQWPSQKLGTRPIYLLQPTLLAAQSPSALKTDAGPFSKALVLLPSLAYNLS